ncbi:hypothetical protein [Gordonia crocea]|uniref:Permease n=1 Tax=Gordonia crocea TaxID=589162 RepID=A0A7I9UXQ0_9ACTN|nr:hypothetical protein [Gordonia crocea]GED97974.1 hypothetical protein nbrc107697_20130 [Gordonia crocea]
MTNDDSPNVVPTDPAVPAPAEGHPPVEDTPPAPAPKGPSFGEKVSHLVKRLLLALIGVAILVIAYFILAAFVPRQWGERIGRLVDGSLTSGTFMGITFGVVCTLVPIVCFAMAVASWGRLKHVIGVLFLIVGVVFAIPNLLTLAVHSGTNNSAQIGRRLLEQNAPGFQGGTLVGAIIGAVIALVIVIFIVNYKVRGQKIKAVKHAVETE